jgi:hypothetical protein
MTTKLSLKRKSLGSGKYRRWSRFDLITLQDRWWVDTHGDIHDINKIDLDYQQNLLMWLRDNARRFKFPYDLITSLEGITINGDIAQQNYEQAMWELYEMSPEDWIESCPLTKRLVELTGLKPSRYIPPLAIYDVRSRFGPRVRDGVKISREQRFKEVVNALIDNDIMPYPSAVYFCIFKAAKSTGKVNMDGLEARWRREALIARGWVKGKNGRWHDPAH